MLKIGIIGCGRITEVRHAPEYSENKDCEIIGFFDVDPKRAKAMAEVYGGAVFGSVEDMLGAKPDAVSVCAANKYHADITIKALQSGAHVLCEKPMATTLDECERMLAAARSSKRMLVIGHNQRLAIAHTRARELIVSGAIGRPLTFRTTFGHAGPEGWTRQQNSWFFDKNQAAFGAMADLGAHKIDVVNYLLGEPVVEVSAYLSTLDKKYSDGSPISVDDNAIFVMRTESGAVGTMHASWVFYGSEDNSTIIFGSNGILRVYADPLYSLILEEKSGEVTKFELDPITTNDEQLSGKRRSTGVIDDFVSSVISGVPSVNDSSHAIQAMRVIFAAIRSNESNHCPIVIGQ